MLCDQNYLERHSGRQGPGHVDTKERLIPSTICDSAYLEQAFENDQAFFLKIIGAQNPAEMKTKLVDNPRMMLVDSDFYKIRLLPFIRRTMKTTVPQLARTFGLSRDKIAEVLRSPRPVPT